jgi:hypothetical protein
MKTYRIDVDQEIFHFLKKHAEPFEDTPNSVLRRFLFGNDRKREEHRNETGARSNLPDFPQSVPRALAQVLEVVYGFHKLGLSRKEATKMEALKRDYDYQTIIDKYCRQLGKRAFEVDQLLEPENITEFQSLLEEKFPNHRDTTREFFDSLRS